MPHVTEEIWSQFHDAPADPRPLARAARRRDPAAAEAMERVQERRGDLPPQRRARPRSTARRSADLRRRRQARAAAGAGRRRALEAERERLAQGDRARRGDARERARSSRKAPAELVEAERAKLARYRAELEALDETASRGRRAAPRHTLPCAPPRPSRRRRRLPRALSPWPERVRARADAGAPRRARRPAARATRRSTSSARTARPRRRCMTAALLRARGPARRRHDLAARARLAERIQVDGERGGPRRGARPRPAPRRGRDPVRGADRGGARRVRRPRGRRRRRRGRARRPARRDERARGAASSCSRTSRSSTPRCSARPARRSPPRSSPSSRPAPPSCSASPSGRRWRAPPARPGSCSSARLEPRARRRRRRALPRRAASTRRRPRQLAVPGRLERRAERPLEIWDGAHNLAGVAYLLARLPGRALHDRRLDPRRQGRRGDAARRSPCVGDDARRDAPRRTRARCPPRSSPRSAEPLFARVEAVADPAAALARARELAGRRRAVLVTGSLYLLAELSLDG